MKTIRETLICALLGVLIGAAFAAESDGATAPDLSPTTFMPCKGRSMLPEFPDNWWLEVHHPAFSSLKVGDVVVYRNAWMGYISHRIVRKDWLGHWITKGDANEREDMGILTEREYIGVSHAIPDVVFHGNLGP